MSREVQHAVARTEVFSDSSGKEADGSRTGRWVMPTFAAAAVQSTRQAHLFNGIHTDLTHIHTQKARVGEQHTSGPNHDSRKLPRITESVMPTGGKFAGNRLGGGNRLGDAPGSSRGAYRHALPLQRDARTAAAPGSLRAD